MRLYEESEMVHNMSHVKTDCTSLKTIINSMKAS